MGGRITRNGAESRTATPGRQAWLSEFDGRSRVRWRVILPAGKSQRKIAAKNPLTFRKNRRGTEAERSELGTLLAGVGGCCTIVSSVAGRNDDSTGRLATSSVGGGATRLLALNTNG